MALDDPPSRGLLGDVGVGWGMLGGDGAPPVAPAGPVRLGAPRIHGGSQLAAGQLHHRGRTRLHATPLRAGSRLAFVSLHQLTTQTRTLELLVQAGYRRTGQLVVAGTALAGTGIRRTSEAADAPVETRAPSLGW